MTESNPRWLITCSCGWTREFSQRWAVESAAKLHPKLRDLGTAHRVRVEPPPNGTRRRSDLPPA